MSNLSKEQIVYNLATEVRDNNIESFDEFINSMKEDKDMCGVLFGSMEQYAAQQTATLEKEVEGLKKELRRIQIIQGEWFNDDEAKKLLSNVFAIVSQALNE